MLRTTRKSSDDSYKVLCGTCPDEQCQAQLYFPAYDTSIECTSCGQRHEKSTLHDIAEVTNPSVALHNILKNILLGNLKPKKGSDNVKVLGLSNFVCKLISPILTTFGMDKKTGRARLLSEMGQGETFDCGRILGDRAFLIEEEYIDVVGYGRDRTGSIRYLADTLAVINDLNNNEERLIPVHADGDGHCLVHAISRALVGRELFWHALRINLWKHCKTNLDKYKELFKDFVDTDEWGDIIDECDPDFIPPDGEPLGLRNIHVFGLANVLRRPILLLDSVSGMQSLADYSGVFLPALHPPEECRGKDGTWNKPLCIAWSSSGRNHYIPLVGIKGKSQPRLPRYMIQKAWGMPSTLIEKYVHFDEQGFCEVGGDKCINDKYIRQLVSAMEEIFMEKHGVKAPLVADVHQYLYKAAGIVGVKPETVLQTAQKAILEKKLYRCLTCDALAEYNLPSEWFQRGGSLYSLAYQSHGELRSDKKYSFPLQGVICSYDTQRDVLIPDMERSQLSKCTFCQGDHVRLLHGNGSIQYENGDRTSTRSTSGRCACGFKHWWEGKEYDNIPEIFPISLEWNGKVVGEKVVWFQHETDPSMNSNVFEVAQALVQKHFPGEFGSERLVQRVVDTILRQTAVKENALKQDEHPSPAERPWSPETASKIILTGPVHKTLHKEELNKSETEKQIHKQIVANAPKQQQKLSGEKSSRPDPTRTSPKRGTRDPHSPGSPSSRRTATTTTSPSTSSTPSPPATTPPSGEKKVRVATSDGRQVMLTLPADVTYTQLQQLISDSIGVPAERQKIRIGFPPKELKPVEEGEEDKAIPLQHGDKISLEVLPDPMAVDSVKAKHLPSPTGSTHTHRSPKFSWSSFEEDAHSHTADKLLQGLKDAQNAGDSLDASIASLAIMATLSGKDLWNYVKTMPHLFSVGGLFYKQVERDLGLVDGKHCQLPTLPGKVFRYTSKEDRLELCLEPYGHFQVSPQVEANAMDSTQESSGITRWIGSSGAIGSHGDTSAKAFSGHGHSLRGPVGDDRMPSDITEDCHVPHARRLQNFCFPNQHQDSIAEEPGEEEMQVEGGAGSGGGPREAEVMYERLGPGFSVIDQRETNIANESVELFKTLAETIQRTINEEMSDSDPDEQLDFGVPFSGSTGDGVMGLGLHSAGASVVTEDWQEVRKSDSPVKGDKDSGQEENMEPAETLGTEPQTVTMGTESNQSSAMTSEASASGEVSIVTMEQSDAHSIPQQKNTDQINSATGGLTDVNPEKNSEEKMDV